MKKIETKTDKTKSQEKVQGISPIFNKITILANASNKLKLAKWHFTILGVLILNYITFETIGYRINSNILFPIKIILYVSGFLLFIVTIQKLQKIAIYYSFFAISAVLTVLFYAIGGLFIGLLFIVILDPIIPQKLELQTKTLKIYNDSPGFMAPFSLYEIVQPKLSILEKKIGYIQLSKPIDPSNDHFHYSEDTLFYTNHKKMYERTFLNDTIKIMDIY
jgi:hypothetical protein